MATQKEFEFRNVNPLVLLLGFVLIMVVLFGIAKGIFKLISAAAPFMLLAAAVINYKVVLGYGRWILSLFRTNLVFGIVAALFTVIGFPLVSAFLLLRAIASKQSNTVMVGDSNTQPTKGEYIDYEEIDDSDFLNLDDLNKSSQKMNKDLDELLK